MRYEIHIAMSNAAFEEGAGSEVARILRELADKVEPMEIEELAIPARLRDYNGNRVGFGVAQELVP